MATSPLIDRPATFARDEGRGSSRAADAPAPDPIDLALIACTRHIVQMLRRAYPGAIDVEAVASQRFDENAFVAAVERLRDAGEVMYEFFVRDGIHPARFAMLALTAKGKDIAAIRTWPTAVPPI